MFVHLALVALPMLASASNGFLQASLEPSLTAEQVNVVLAAIGDSLGEKHRLETEVRLAPLEELLAPTLKSLPKNDHGKFGYKSARYALNRLFLQRHSWYVKGIEAGNDSSNVTVTRILQDGVPDKIHSIFEAKLGNQGLTAHEVAVMAATFENLAYQESIDRLRSAYTAVSLTMGADLNVKQADHLLDVYAAGFVMKVNLTWLWDEFKTRGPKVLLNFTTHNYPTFSNLRDFLRKIRVESTSNRSTLSFLDMTRVIIRFGDQYGRWQNHECEDLKQKLLALEDDGTGRVSLSKFYSGILSGVRIHDGNWQFSESPDFLRSVGALDETNPANLRVIIPNYLLAPSNCVAASKYYSVCCLDECEDLMDRIEHVVQAPAATPEQIAEIITSMPTSAARSNHMMTDVLRRKLDEIAAANGGIILLHSRMLLQWMHHVYPRECAYPQLSNTTMRMKGVAWENHTGLTYRVSDEEVAQCSSNVAGSEWGQSGEIAWSEVDEVYVEMVVPPIYFAMLSRLRGILQLSALFGVFFAMLYNLVRVSRSSRDQMSDHGKYV